jgi:hypothetical protein
MALLFNVSGVSEAKAYIAGAATRLRSVTSGRFVSGSSVRKNLGEEMLVRNKARMRAGVDVDGKPFKPSARASSGGQTLFDSGALAASINYDTPDGAMQLFSSDKRARVHWEGLLIKPKAGHRFLTIPLRGRGGLFDSLAGGAAPIGNRTGARAGNFAKSTTFFLRRGSSLFLMQRIAAIAGSGGISYHGHKRSKGSSPASSKYTLRALFLLVTQVQMTQRKFFGFGNSDIEMIADKLGGHVVGEGEAK